MQRLQHGIIPAAHKVDDRLRRDIPTGNVMQKRIQRFRIFNRRKENILLRHRNAEFLAGVTEAAQTVATRSVYGRVCHIRNVAVAAREHVFCNLITSGIVIDIHAVAVDSFNLTVYAHNGRA